MLGWLIVLIITIIVIVGVRLIQIKMDYGSYSDWGLFFGLIYFVLSIFGLVVIGIILISPLSVNRNIEDFGEYKYYIEELYVFENEDKCVFMQDENYDSLTKCVADTSVYEEILGYNMWLTEAKASKRGYGIFSFYRFKDLDDLEYIEIEH